jgi:restriction endonuclease Mrr
VSRTPARVPTVGIPDYETLMRPTLAALAKGQPQTRSQIRDAVAAATGIGGDDLAEMLPSGNATVFESRVGWALTYMSQAGLATRPKRGVYVITDRGRTVLDEQPERVDNKVLEQFPEFLEFKARRNEKGSRSERTVSRALSASRPCRPRRRSSGWSRTLTMRWPRSCSTGCSRSRRRFWSGSACDCSARWATGAARLC